MLWTSPMAWTGIFGFAFGYAETVFLRNGVSKKNWWTRTRRIRIAAAMPIEVPILEINPPPVYQSIAPKAQHLQELGLSQSEIGRRLGIDRWTVGKALRWLAQLKRG